MLYSRSMRSSDGLLDAFSRSFGCGLMVLMRYLVNSGLHKVTTAGSVRLPIFNIFEKVRTTYSSTKQIVVVIRLYWELWHATCRLFHCLHFLVPPIGKVSTLLGRDSGAFGQDEGAVVGLGKFLWEILDLCRILWNIHGACSGWAGRLHKQMEIGSTNRVVHAIFGLHRSYSNII